ncbi:hypothetical protein [Streptomyces sp. 142MFCol3.1]|uniref:MmyB family transcriptional regulator n=1 Tax=Streptomyces sp. 142MFCol3.1 TaxID=1172179 RepID=UPI003B63ABF8
MGASICTGWRDCTPGSRRIAHAILCTRSSCDSWKRSRKQPPTCSAPPSTCWNRPRRRCTAVALRGGVEPAGLLFTHPRAETVFTDWPLLQRSTVHALRLAAGRFPAARASVTLPTRSRGPRRSSARWGRSTAWEDCAGPSRCSCPWKWGASS